MMCLSLYQWQQIDNHVVVDMMTKFVFMDRKFKINLERFTLLWLVLALLVVSTSRHLLWWALVVVKVVSSRWLIMTTLRFQTSIGSFCSAKTTLDLQNPKLLVQSLKLWTLTSTFLLTIVSLRLRLKILSTMISGRVKISLWMQSIISRLVTMLTNSVSGMKNLFLSQELLERKQTNRWLFLTRLSAIEILKILLKNLSQCVPYATSLTKLSTALSGAATNSILSSLIERRMQFHISKTQWSSVNNSNKTQQVQELRLSWKK